MARAENPDINSFFPLGLGPGFGGLSGKGVCLHLEEHSGSLWSTISYFVIGDLHRLTLRGKLNSR